MSLFFYHRLIVYDHKFTLAPSKGILDSIAEIEVVVITVVIAFFFQNSHIPLGAFIKGHGRI
jgi:hypothetical protein